MRLILALSSLAALIILTACGGGTEDEEARVQLPTIKCAIGVVSPPIYGPPNPNDATVWGPPRPDPVQEYGPPRPCTL